MKHLRFMILILILINIVHGSNFSRKIELSYLDIVRELAQTPDGGYILVGILSNPCEGLLSPFLIKFDQNDSIIWIKALDITNLDTALIPICPTQDSGCAIVINPDFMVTAPKTTIVKYSKSGRIQWATQISFPYTISVWRFPDITQISDEGFIILIPITISSSNSRIGVFKLNLAGTLEWSKTISTPNSVTKAKVVPETNNKFTVALQTFAPGTNSIVLAQLRSSARAIRTRQFSFPLDVELSDFKKTSDGGYIVAGKCRDAIGYWNIFLIKVDSILSLNWAKIFGINRMNLAVNHVAQTFDGGYIIAGQLIKNYSLKEFLVAKFDSAGDLNWAKVIPDSLSSAEDLFQKQDSSIIVVGKTTKYARYVQASILAKFERNGYNCLTVDTMLTSSVMSPSISLGIVRAETLLITSSHPTVVDTPIPYIDSLICYSTKVAEETKTPMPLKVSLQPNPFNNACVISAPNAASIEIFDISGKRIAQYRRPNVLWKPDEKLGSGVYIVRIRLRNGKTLSYRAFFIK